MECDTQPGKCSIERGTGQGRRLQDLSCCEAHSFRIASTAGASQKLMQLPLVIWSSIQGESDTSAGNGRSVDTESGYISAQGPDPGGHGRRVVAERSNDVLRVDPSPGLYYLE